MKIESSIVRRCFPHSYPFTLLDRVEEYDPEKRFLRGRKAVSQNEPFLQGHFPDHPILPGVIIIEAMGQASGMLMHLDDGFQSGKTTDEIFDRMTTLRREGFLVESRVKHMAGVFPGDVMILETQIQMRRDGLAVFKVQTAVDGNVVGKGQVTMALSLNGQG